jgi:nitrile hydratase
MTDNEHSHPHEHDHRHPHVPITDDGPAAGRRVRLLEDLLVEHGLVSRDEVRQGIDWLVSRSPADGARLVARAWVDPKFKQRLLADAREAALELGLDPGPSPVVAAVENTEDVHHMVVCTLCSCYPKALLGPPPEWYKSLPYRSRAVSDPRGVLAEFGLELPDVEIRILDSTAEIRYLVIPRQPEGTDELSEEELAALVTRDSMIGVANAATPSPSASSARI